MTLTEIELQAGRECLHLRNLDMLEAWMNKHKVIIDRELVRSSLGKLLEAGEITRAIKIFDTVFIGMNPRTDLVGFYLKLATAGFIMLLCLLCIIGAIGGVVYLFRVVFA